MSIEVPSSARREAGLFVDSLSAAKLVQGSDVYYPTLKLNPLAPRTDAGPEMDLYETIDRQSHHRYTDRNNHLTVYGTFAASPHVNSPEPNIPLHLLTWWYNNGAVDLGTLGKEFIEGKPERMNSIIRLISESVADNYGILQENTKKLGMEDPSFSLYYLTGHNNDRRRSRGPMSSEVNHINLCANIDDTQYRSVQPIDMRELWKMAGVHDTVFMDTLGPLLGQRFSDTMRQYYSQVGCTFRIFEEHERSSDGLSIRNNEGFDVIFKHPQTIPDLLRYIALFHAVGDNAFTLSQEVFSASLKELLPHHPNKKERADVALQWFGPQYMEQGYTLGEAKAFIDYTLSFEPTIHEMRDLASQVSGDHPIHRLLEKAQKKQDRFFSVDAEGTWVVNEDEVARYAHNYAKHYNVSPLAARMLMQQSLDRISPLRPENAFAARMPSATGIIDPVMNSQGDIVASKIRMSPRLVSLQAWREGLDGARLERQLAHSQ
ncbi:MAG: hypothetical protein NUV52_03615 [Candidatus Roizmanbacteria bacterium]|nr:hypothetical protein [Candidatus Roizmanbacteria bacterium]